MISRLILIFLISFFCINSNDKIKIKYKIGDKIITNQDIIDEKKYLLFLRPSLNSINKNELDELAKNSIIREIIKKREINKAYKNINEKELIDKIKLDILKFKKIKNDKELRILLKQNRINHNILIEKLKYESLWNQLIYQKFKNSIKIDKSYLENQLIERNKNNKKYEYNLSELLFEIEKLENFNDKKKKILKSINVNGFKNTVAKYSIADSASKGGQIGWVKETLLSDKLIKILNKMEEDSISNAIKYPNGYLILKVNNKREIKQKINMETELKEFIRFQKNKQLNQFSLLFFKKLKKNTIINEY